MSESDSGARLLSDWLSNPENLRQPEMVIPHIAVEGCVSLLSGREKIGKSTLAAGAVAAASRGDAVLGVCLPDQRRTLWYTNDERVDFTVRRFQALLANPDGLVINDRPRQFSELLDTLARDLETFPDVGVVVVDTFSRVLAVSGVDPDRSAQVEPVMAKLVDFFHAQNVAAVLLYHTGKPGREYRGSTAIGAGVDEILTLRRRGQSEEDDFDEASSDDGRRLLVQDGRTLRGRIQLTFRDGLYHLFEETSQPRQRIEQTLRDHGTVSGRAELTKLAGVRKQLGLKIIGELIGSGAIVEWGRQLRVGSSLSPQFPDKGTNTEPLQEPLLMSGSHSGGGGVTETGTTAPVMLGEVE